MIAKGIVDILYGTNRIKSNYQITHPDETIAAADASKGIMTSENQELKRGFDWVASQRDVILLTNKNIICGKWTIPLDNIENAQLVKFKTILGGGQVLKIQTKDHESYQFGMQLNPEWAEQHILPLTIEDGKLKYSTFSIVVRVILIGYLLYWVYDRFIMNR